MQGKALTIRPGLPWDRSVREVERSAVLVSGQATLAGRLTKAFSQCRPGLLCVVLNEAIGRHAQAAHFASHFQGIGMVHAAADGH